MNFFFFFYKNDFEVRLVHGSKSIGLWKPTVLMC